MNRPVIDTVYLWMACALYDNDEDDDNLILYVLAENKLVSRHDVYIVVVKTREKFIKLEYNTLTQCHFFRKLWDSTSR